jgi:hypothetical protein
MCLVYHDEAKLGVLSAAELDSLLQECDDWIGELEKSGRHIMSAGLQTARTAVSIRGLPGKAKTTDGPFAETKEILGGFTLLEVRDRAEALEIASRMPPLRIGTVELRPVLDADGVATNPLDQKVATAMRARGWPVRPTR